MNLNEMTDEQFRDHVHEILERELGREGMLRFLALPRYRQGDYTEERSEWIDDLTLEDVIRGVKEVEHSRRG